MHREDVTSRPQCSQQFRQTFWLSCQFCVGVKADRSATSWSTRLLHKFFLIIQLSLWLSVSFKQFYSTVSFITWWETFEIWKSFKWKLVYESILYLSIKASKLMQIILKIVEKSFWILQLLLIVKFFKGFSLCSWKLPFFFSKEVASDFSTW